MLFNSTEFLRFFALFFAAYILVRNNLALRNGLILIASYVFYASWDYRFTALLFFTSTVDFVLARLIDGSESPKVRRTLLTLSVSANLGVLGFFKYFGFFRESSDALFNTLGADTNWATWGWVLPVGISFYTFQSISYVVDVYRRQLPASRHFVRFLAYVSFFPQLVAGPIERGKRLLPQFSQTLKITAADFEAGMWLILWGLFQKVVLSDNLAPLVELIYGQDTNSGPMIILGTVAFGLRIYCDFAGYSDIARGLGKLLGFDLMRNFNRPYLASSLRDFWSRWHISLSTWLRDYLYIPLGGNRRGEGRTYLNLAITLLLGGLWHGADATFILWGGWHGLGLIANHWWERHRPRAIVFPGWLGWGITCLFVLYGWMLFRAQSLEQMARFTRDLVHFALPTWWKPYLVNLVILASPLVVAHTWRWRPAQADIPPLSSPWARAVLQAAMLLMIAAFWTPEASPFIYFQF